MEASADQNSLSDEEIPACKGTGLRLHASDRGDLICPDCGTKFLVARPGHTVQIDKHWPPIGLPRKL